MILAVRDISIKQRYMSFIITRPACTISTGDRVHQTAIRDTPPSAVTRFRVRTTIKLRLNCMSLAFESSNEDDGSLSALPTYRPVGHDTSASPV
jgi:hypothetical protein